MRLLIIGGTLFLGRALVERALERGHDVTLFHRGRTNPELFPGVERVLGDRASDLDRLAGGQWDAVIDTFGQIPKQVRAAARLLSSRVGHYTFVSSISVYPDFGARGHAHGAEIHEPADESVEELQMELYGQMKVACEQAAAEEMNGRCCLVRPGLIVGPQDRSDRFTYWPRRLARGGEVLAPLPLNREVQLIDVRDCAEFCLIAAEKELTGPYDATGPEASLDFESMVETCREVAGAESSVTWVDPAWLQEQGVGIWMELPLWVPEVDARIDVRPAIGQGMSLRPLAETARDTLAWSEELPADHPWRAGLAPERESELLKAWKARGGD
jgi:2'-hydroxyisoflavone reductase